jgi:hypothetical protein
MPKNTSRAPSAEAAVAPSTNHLILLQLSPMLSPEAGKAMIHHPLKGNCGDTMAFLPPVAACTLIVNDHLIRNEADQIGNKTFQHRSALVKGVCALALSRLLSWIIRVDGIIL